MPTITTYLVGTTLSAVVAVAGATHGTETFDRVLAMVKGASVTDETIHLAGVIEIEDEDKAPRTLECVATSASPCDHFANYDGYKIRGDNAYTLVPVHDKDDTRAFVLIGVSADGEQRAAYDTRKGGLTSLAHTALAGFVESNPDADPAVAAADQAAIEMAATALVDQVKAWSTKRISNPPHTNPA